VGGGAHAYWSTRSPARAAPTWSAHNERSVLDSGQLTCYLARDDGSKSCRQLVPERKDQTGCGGGLLADGRWEQGKRLELLIGKRALICFLREQQEGNMSTRYRLMVDGRVHT
jgi:hypothetical protein